MTPESLTWVQMPAWSPAVLTVLLMAVYLAFGCTVVLRLRIDRRAAGKRPRRIH